MTGFREAVLTGTGLRGPTANWLGWGGHRGSAPSPFDAVNGSRLAGMIGTHPLALLSADEMISRSSAGLDGDIVIDNPGAVRIGGGIEGRLSVTARHQISARGALMRLVGCLVAEQRMSVPTGDSSRIEWVEVRGKIFEQLPFADVALPPALVAGQHFETPFVLPAPRLGPASAHLGSAILAWAIEARWDVGLAGDERLAAVVNVGQDMDYLRSGSVRLEPGAMFDVWTVGDASIAVQPLPPIVPGSEIEVSVNWPSAGAGRGARIELQANVEAPNAMKGVVLSSTALDPAALRGGTTVRIVVPPDAPPTLAEQGVAVNYRLRALVDRPMRADLAVERALAVL